MFMFPKKSLVNLKNVNENQNRPTAETFIIF
jgi:hypothetical protein